MSVSQVGCLPLDFTCSNLCLSELGVLSPSRFLTLPLPLAKREYLDMWREMDDTSEVVSAVSGVMANTDACVARLKANNIFQVARRSVNEQVRGQAERLGKTGGDWGCASQIRTLVSRRADMLCLAGRVSIFGQQLPQTCLLAQADGRVIGFDLHVCQVHQQHRGTD